MLARDIINLCEEMMRDLPNWKKLHKEWIIPVKDVPRYVYHITSPKSWESIQREGLKPSGYRRKRLKGRLYVFPPTRYNEIPFLKVGLGGVILRIDTHKLPPTTHFWTNYWFEDEIGNPLWQMWTENVIPISAITRVSDLLPRLKSYIISPRLPDKEKWTKGQYG